MIVAIIGDRYEGYWMDKDIASWPTMPHVDVTQKFFERYEAYEAEREYVQSKLHRYSEEAIQKKLLEDCSKGRKSIGF